jgi:hypothetical protein
MRLEFMLKLHFARLEGSAVAARLVARQRRLCAEWLTGPLVVTDGVDSGGHSVAVRRFRQGQIQAISDWLVWLAEDLTKVAQ